MLQERLLIGCLETKVIKVMIGVKMKKENNKFRVNLRDLKALKNPELTLKKLIGSCSKRRRKRRKKK